MSAVPLRLFVGSYTLSSPWADAPEGHGSGITTLDFDSSDRSLQVIGSNWATNPSFLVAEGSTLLSITEPELGGELVSFAVESGGVRDVRHVTTGQDAPCHVSLHPTARVALVSHYLGGGVSVMGLDGGHPTIVLSCFQLEAAGEGWSRSAVASRPHATLPIPQTLEFVVADCGRDTVSLYRWNALTTRAELVDIVVLAEGTGPRHLAWNKWTGSIYVSGQNAGQLIVIAYEADDASSRIRLHQVVAVEGLGRGKPIPSEVAVHPSGRAR